MIRVTSVWHPYGDHSISNQVRKRKSACESQSNKLLKVSVPLLESWAIISIMYTSEHKKDEEMVLMCSEDVAQIQNAVDKPLMPAGLRDSIATGSVPQDWRIANVVPIFKKSSKSEPGNYRPYCQENADTGKEELIDRYLLVTICSGSEQSWLVILLRHIDKAAPSLLLCESGRKKEVAKEEEASRMKLLGLVQTVHPNHSSDKRPGETCLSYNALRFLLSFFLDKSAEHNSFCMPAGSTCSPPLPDTRQRNCRHRAASRIKGKEKRGWTLNSAGYLLGPRK
ncbi:unnamed protein product [Ranitomeya imitator]|uniref:Galanin domain-containing protein n=1 Tax=Ranitomeya imitator TaxID=111125 RepID=A0ABN9LPG8_9NEOB|nr:unnamed protein product [Ranitomeya imitator]